VQKKIKIDMTLHIKKNIVLYLIVLFAILTGIASGIFTACSMTYEQKYALGDYLKAFFQHNNHESVNRIAIFWKSLKQNLQYSFFVWIAGLMLFGSPIIFLIIGMRCFFIGFALGFLLDRFHIRGFLFILLCILPQTLIYLSGFLLMGVISMENSINRFKRRKLILPKEQIKQETLYYIIKISILLLLLSIGSITEAYLSPAFFGLLSWIFD